MCFLQVLIKIDPRTESRTFTVIAKAVLQLRIALCTLSESVLEIPLKGSILPFKGFEGPVVPRCKRLLGDLGASWCILF